MGLRHGRRKQSATDFTQQQPAFMTRLDLHVLLDAEAKALQFESIMQSCIRTWDFRLDSSCCFLSRAGGAGAVLAV